MSDAYHVWGNDLVLDAAGGLLMTDGTDFGVQRVLRRLLTNTTDYLWHLDYGAGLPARIGEPTVAGEIMAICRSQMLLESAVAATPEPVVEVSEITDGFYVAIRYTDADTGRPVSTGFSVSQ